jgi:hypothetical protein
MKKILLVLLLCMFIPSNVYATGGCVKTSSIVSCNGEYYGKHGDGHWHVAVLRSGRWYATGREIDSNPCSKTTTTTTTSKTTVPFTSTTTTTTVPVTTTSVTTTVGTTCNCTCNEESVKETSSVGSDVDGYVLTTGAGYCLFKVLSIFRRK